MKSIYGAILRLDDLEDILGKTIPAKALASISDLALGNGMKRFSIKLIDYEAVILDDDSDEAQELRELKDTDENFILDMNYNMRTYRKLGKREAVAKTTLLFRGDDGQTYRISLVNSVKIKTITRDYDSMMFDACYQYAKEMIEYLPLDMYTSKELNLPEKYADIDQKDKIHYDGYKESRGTRKESVN